MRYCLECPANRYVFKSRLNCSESTAGSLRQSGREFQTVGPATEKADVAWQARLMTVSVAAATGSVLEIQYLHLLTGVKFLCGHRACVKSDKA